VRVPAQLSRFSQLLELAALRGEFAKIALAIAVVITIAVLGVAVQELRTGITHRAIGWLAHGCG
jgi:hypothetical protein